MVRTMEYRAHHYLPPKTGSLLELNLMRNPTGVSLVYAQNLVVKLNCTCNRAFLNVSVE
jgi:hypothetical protein